MAEGSGASAVIRGRARTSASGETNSSANSVHADQDPAGSNSEDITVEWAGDTRIGGGTPDKGELPGQGATRMDSMTIWVFGTS
jgi:hypothetical protein